MRCLGRCGCVRPVLQLVSMVEGGLCCCLFVSFFWGEGKVWLWLTIFNCLPVCVWREQGSRGCGMVMESCFDHAMIHLSAYMMGGGVVMVVGYL